MKMKTTILVTAVAAVAVAVCGVSCNNNNSSESPKQRSAVDTVGFQEQHLIVVPTGGDVRLEYVKLNGQLFNVQQTPQDEHPIVRCWKRARVEQVSDTSFAVFMVHNNSNIVDNRGLVIYYTDSLSQSRVHTLIQRADPKPDYSKNYVVDTVLSTVSGAAGTFTLKLPFEFSELLSMELGHRSEHAQIFKAYLESSISKSFCKSDQLNVIVDILTRELELTFPYAEKREPQLINLVFGNASPCQADGIPWQPMYLIKLSDTPDTMCLL